MSRLLAFLRRRRVVSGNTATPVLALTLVGLFAALWWSLAFISPDTSGRELSIDELTEVIDAGEVDRAIVLDEDARIDGVLRDGTRFFVAYPKAGSTLAQLITDMAASGARVEVDPQSTKAIARLLASALLPLLILANLFALIYVAGRGRAGGMGEVVDFSRVRRGRARASVTFDDVAGVDEAREELEEAIAYLKDPGRFAELRAMPPKGVLLHGPPGCGKTLLAKAVAGEAGVPFFAVSGAEFVESLVGVGAARVRDLFAKVRGAAPAIVFIDELDAAGRTRGAGPGGGGSEERDQTLNQLLVEMDGFDVGTGIVVIAATNRPDIIDPALLRPGRFDRHVVISRPDLERRTEILELHARDRPMAADVDLADVARQTPGFTGADLANVINEAALLSIRNRSARIDGSIMSEAVQRVLSGPRRRGHLLDADERRRVAYHEAGHAVAATLVGRAADVHRLSIVAYGRGLGATTLGEEDAAVRTRSELRDRLFVVLGGWGAEQLVFDEPSTGSEDDLEVATDLARDMVGRYGMTDLGPARLLGRDSDVYLRDGQATADVSSETHAAFDRAVQGLLEEVGTGVVTALRRKRKALDALAEKVAAAETIEGEELQRLLASVGRKAPARRR